MDAKMNMKNDPYPSTAPPPYPGPPPGPSHPVQFIPAGQPQVTLIHPPTTTVIQGGAVVPAAVVVTNSMGPSATPYVCRSCNCQIITRVETIPSMRTHLFAILLCVIGCWPCVCLPYCMDSCNNTDHYCPNCNAYIGSYNS